ncbi:hypothetical protein VP91_00011730 [Candidatus Pelagibacter ubique]|uniref:SPOR domain-containing protein n=1 Tax=Pelagibacter ubique TaxID=198252 RepID=A0ABX1T589_PELUQ|nr:hypothetical protein [Candidatus Pelagibacter ubique]NMN68016.1 hypothetical protein [Candidatus Pelagibacter ubique]
MLYKNILSIIIFLLLSNCTTNNLLNNKHNKTIENVYSNKGFALVYSDNLYKKKILSKKIEERSLVIFQKNLKLNTQVIIRNILNDKSIIGVVGKNSSYPSFNNSVLSIRIADELDLDKSQPFVEISEIRGNSIFVAKKAKTYDEERNVAVKAPVNEISINDLNIPKKSVKKKQNLKFLYSIKIADFYFKNTALSMLNRINAYSLVNKAKIKKINNKKYRVYLGPFSNINSLKKSYNDISILQFENIEIIKND